MKNTLSIFASCFLMLICTQISAQDNCEKEISTNPSAPFNAHSFNGRYNPWINSDFDVGSLYLATSELIELNDQVNWATTFLTGASNLFMDNPYTSNGTPHHRYNYLHPSGVVFELRDYKWTDGWELLWLGTGFYPNGENVNNEVLTRAYAPAYPNAANSNVPYFVLYNRYRGVMRTFMNLMTNFGSYSDVKTLMSIQGDENLSGLLRHLDPYDKALDQATNVDQVESFNPRPGDWNQWYSIDYNLGYDPCLCGQEQEIVIDMWGIDEFSLEMYGRGVAVDVPLVQNGAPDYDLDWLTTHDVNAGLNGGTRIFTKMDALVADYNQDMMHYAAQNQVYQDYQQRQQLLNAFKGLIVDATITAITGGFAAVPKYAVKPKGPFFSATMAAFGIELNQDTPASPENSQSALGKFIKASGKGLLGYGYDQLSMGVNPIQNQPKPPDMPMATYSEMRFSGSITGLSQPATIGPFFVPGSYDEQSSLSNLSSPYMYPAYNAPTGMVALLKTLSPAFRFESTADEDIIFEDFPECAHDLIYTADVDFKLRFDDAPLLALNPSLDFDLSRTASYVMVELHFEDEVPAPMGSFTTIESTIAGNMFLEFQRNEANRRVYQYNSKWIMLEDLNQHLFSMNLTDQYTLQSDAYWEYVDAWGTWECNDGTPHNFESSDTRKKLTQVKIKLLHDYYFDQVGSNGEQVNTTQVFSYLLFDEESDVNFLGNTSDWTLSPPELIEYYAPGLITLGDETITTAHPYAYEVVGNEIFINAQEILINGPLEVEPGYTAVIQALEQVHIEPGADGASLTPNVHVRIKKDFYNTPVFGYADDLAVSDFCTGTDYQANTASKALRDRIQAQQEQAELEEITPEVEANNKVAIYPNPANGFIQLRSSDLGISQVDVYDIAGRLMLQRNYGADAGKQVQMDIQNLQSGVYIVQIHCGAQVHKEKLVVGL